MSLKKGAYTTHTLKTEQRKQVMNERKQSQALDLLVLPS